MKHETAAFINNHRCDDVARLALQIDGRADSDLILRQIEGWQRLRYKVPSWASADELLYPKRLSIEQASGEVAARYKEQIAKRLLPSGSTMADLTGGFGVDFSFMARNFDSAVYVERDEELCMLARHNFSLLGLSANIVNSDGVEYLKNMQSVDLIFIDPARRDNVGRKTVGISDCEPDITALLPLLREKSEYTLVKLSPMLDWHEAMRSINAIKRCVTEIHVVASDGECKELLFVLGDEDLSASPMIYCSDGESSFSFRPEDEEQCVYTIASTPNTYIYEPNAAIMKAGAFKSVGQRYGLQKLHKNSHLYTSDSKVDMFPGRCFRLIDIDGFGKQEVKTLVGRQANLTIRNFPESAATLRRRLRLTDGGDEYWFATTLADNRKVILRCTKA